MKSLRRTLSHTNANVLNKFRTQYSITAGDADVLFRDTLRWLHLCAKAQHDRAVGRPGTPERLVIHVPMLIIDEMWHVFCLHTREYADFCSTYLGSFVHHAPAHPDFEPPSEAQTLEQLRYIDRVLGRATLRRWYDDFAARYTPERILELERPRRLGIPCERLA